jgi:hypothetical protein
MAHDEFLKLPSVPLSALKRPEYKSGNYLAQRDLLTEQQYRLQRLRRHNRYLHGWGVVCGLWLVPAEDSARPWAVQVCPGYAIGPYGDEIQLRAPVMVDIRDYLWRRPRERVLTAARVAYVGIRYDEEQVRLVPSNPSGCDCDDPNYESSRIRDSFQVNILWALSGKSDTEKINICEQHLAPCPVCADSPYLILARVSLPTGESEPITMSGIDNCSERRQLHSTTTLHNQMISCCCTQKQR